MVNSFVYCPALDGSFQEPLNPLSPSFDELSEAVSQGDIDTLQGALSKGFPVNQADENGWTLLMIAAYYLQIEMVGILLGFGADANLVDSKGLSAIIHVADCYDKHHIGCNYAKKEILKLLVPATLSIADRYHGGGSLLALLAGTMRLELFEEVLQLHPEYDQEKQYADQVLRIQELVITNGLEGIEYIDNQAVEFIGFWPQPIREFCCWNLKEFNRPDLNKEEILQAINVENENTLSVASIVERVHTRRLTYLEAGWKGHCIYLVIFNNCAAHQSYFAICNRGEGSNGESTSVFQINSLLFTPQILAAIENMRYQDCLAGRPFCYEQLPSLLSPNGVAHKVSLTFYTGGKEQQAETCVLSSLKEAIALSHFFLHPPSNKEEEREAILWRKEFSLHMRCVAWMRHFDHFKDSEEFTWISAVAIEQTALKKIFDYADAKRSYLGNKSLILPQIFQDYLRTQCSHLPFFREWVSRL